MKLRTCTVKELIEALQDEDPEARVVFASDYGDHGHTQQIHAIAGDVEEKVVQESGYSDSGWAISQRDAEDDEEEEEHKVLVIS